ncbi:MAG TPA: aminotransferase class III-fold pyridoxal phosphate-dependent enzyme [Candidatus Binatia bacterium]|jgi:adenosylmethionine-8-amino-7-oxononanoate aminotransferase|nr:aminotransferase class III-fold pyridoxal phosphate-dependent enzyme [Candidatus Binatia bacterium]
MHPLAKLDHRYLWHPFTQMREWLKREPLVIVEGQGAVLRDVHGREYLDANSSIWTNLHGHNHPKINAALQHQLKRIAHSSALGLANEPASRLAAKLVGLTRLGKVFFSDDGSTAVEVALKLAYEFARRTRRTKKPRFVSLEGAYHGDTVGGVALGHIDQFHKAYSALLFRTDKVMSPYCYRCRFNRAKPERADAREYRKCNWECLDVLEQKFKAQKKQGNPYAGFVFEPLIQGAAGMIPQPAGWLRRAAQIARDYGALLIADEVMTGFGRTGIPGGAVSEISEKVSERVSRTQRPSFSPPHPHPPSLFASHHEGVQPDFLALAKGLTGGYLPMAATLTTQAVFDAFLGEYEDFKTFFHGHSFTANQLGAAAALASLDILQSPGSIRARQRLERSFRKELRTLWAHPNVGDIRQVGLVAGVELVKDWRTREPFDLREQAGIRVCETMAKQGVLTRPIGNVIVLMPPYCTTPGEVRRMVNSVGRAISGKLARE